MTASLGAPTLVSATGGAAARVAAANNATGRFFEENADRVARACHAMAVRFQQGGRLIVHGVGAQRSDVAHVVVEFVHPVIVGKRALGAFALPEPAALETLGREGDIFLLLAAGATVAPADVELLARARNRGLLALALTGNTSPAAGPAIDADFHFAVPSDDPTIVQETHEVLYHVLWELVHVFFEHRGTAA